MDLATDWGAAASVLSLLIVLVTDALIGGLPGLRTILDAPLNAVRAFGRWFDGKLNRVRRGGRTRRLRGLLVVMIVSILAWVVGTALTGAARSMPQGWIIEVAVLLVLVRQGDALGRMNRGAKLLGAGRFADAKDAIGPLVRYDATRLDDFGIARASIEGGMTRFASGFLTTIFWFLLLGLPAVIVCRSLNAVADVIGNRSPRHETFGFAVARIDDILTLPSAFIAGPLVSLAAIFVPRASVSGALSGWFADLGQRGFRSEFRGEGAMAGALGVALGGPRPYGDDVIGGAWIGDGRARATVSDIQRAVFLLAIACLLASIGLALAVMV
jgi:adenosylcobinamide-phosphate synthase